MIFQSTGAFPKSNILEISSNPAYDFISAYEMSSGLYHKNINQILKDLSKSHKIAIHNYFPVPKSPFVLNLSSQNPEIIATSISHVRNSIDVAKEFCRPYYSFHAGFLIDPLPNELGNINAKKERIQRKDGLKTFADNVNLLSQYAEEKNITLMIENNVCSGNTLDRFGDSPLLFSDIAGAKELKSLINSNVKFLCDYAHLKVSSNILCFDPEAFLEEISERFIAAHLSDNDGLEDQNLCFDSSAWFWDHLPKDLEYYSVEVYQDEPSILEKCHNLLRGHINGL
tara:strand:- start:1754 stop:2605 length:852 start_codon:yes stop_codon:yes gene_type:complete